MTLAASSLRRPPGLRRLRGWPSRHARGLERLYAAFERLMTVAAPLARRLPRRRLEAVLAPVERAAKGLVFGCRMCGECTLKQTGMSCPMTCPKTLRNGPCGGVRAGGFCEVVPGMRCVWLDAWDGAARMRTGRGAIESAGPPVDMRDAGRSTWAAVMLGEHGAKPAAAESAPVPCSAIETAPRSALETALRRGRFCVTAEFNPPDTADADAICAAARPLLEICDSVNVTDGAGANTHIASLAVCALLARRGYEPVMQIACRDRNRIAVQADALGAAALGIRNVLCLTGDGIGGGDQPGARPVFDLDCVSLLATLRGLGESGRFASGRAIETPPALFLGATSNPTALPAEVEVGRLAKKIAAGAQFLQTQFCFDVAAFERFLARYRDRGLDERAPLLVGVGVLPSARAARWMLSSIAGVRIPDAVIDRLERAPDPQAEGIAIALETVAALRAMKGVSGIHVMAFRRPQAVREIVERAGLAGRLAAASG